MICTHPHRSAPFSKLAFTVSVVAWAATAVSAVGCSKSGESNGASDPTASAVDSEAGGGPAVPTPGPNSGLGGEGSGEGGTQSETPSAGGAANPAPVMGTGLCGAAEGQLFSASHPWNQRVDSAALDAESGAIIAYLQSNHVSGQRFRIDGPSDEPNSLYGITVLSAGAETAHVDFSESGDFYSPDCDHVPVPLPQGGAIEGEEAYACDNDGDCHLIVVDTAECRLFEMWRANSSGSNFDGGCLAVWDLTESYSDTLRGDCCTSADAAGLPIAAHMFNADEIAAGVIAHALRFILPNELMNASTCALRRTRPARLLEVRTRRPTVRACGCVRTLT